MQSVVFSGARTILKFGSNPIGYCLGVNGSAGINYQPLQALGHLEALEHIPTAYVVEMSANLARVANFTRLAVGNSFPGLRAAIDGGANSPQVMPAFGDNGLSILQSGELDANIVDRVINKTLYQVSGLKCSQKNWDSTAAGSVSENCAFVARIMNEPGENADGTIGDIGTEQFNVPA